MAKPKTMIIYAATASIAALAADAATARERGQAVRFIALEEFRGETEQNAGAVYVERRAGDELIVDRIRQAYPMIEVQDLGSSGVDLDDHESFQPTPADDTVKELRLRLIGLGGSAPAGADAAQLADLIAAQLAHTNRTPILPSPASQGTTIPDATPISQRPDGDKLLDAGATGTSAASIEAATQVAGEAPSGAGGPTASASVTSDTPPAATDEDSAFAETFIGRNLDDISDEDFDGLTEAQKAAVIAAERDREKPRVTLLRRLGADA